MRISREVQELSLVRLDNGGLFYSIEIKIILAMRKINAILRGLSAVFKKVIISA